MSSSSETNLNAIRKCILNIRLSHLTNRSAEKGCTELRTRVYQVYTEAAHLRFSPPPGSHLEDALSYVSKLERGGSSNAKMIEDARFVGILRCVSEGRNRDDSLLVLEKNVDGKLEEARNIVKSIESPIKSSPVRSPSKSQSPLYKKDFVSDKIVELSEDLRVAERDSTLLDLEIADPLYPSSTQTHTQRKTETIEKIKNIKTSLEKLNLDSSSTSPQIVKLTSCSLPPTPYPVKSPLPTPPTPPPLSPDSIETSHIQVEVVMVSSPPPKPLPFPPEPLPRPTYDESMKVVSYNSIKNSKTGQPVISNLQVKRRNPRQQIQRPPLHLPDPEPLPFQEINLKLITDVKNYHSKTVKRLKEYKKKNDPGFKKRENMEMLKKERVMESVERIVEMQGEKVRRSVKVERRRDVRNISEAEKTSLDTSKKSKLSVKQKAQQEYARLRALQRIRMAKEGERGEAERKEREGRERKEEERRGREERIKKFVERQEERERREQDEHLRQQLRERKRQEALFTEVENAGGPDHLESARERVRERLESDYFLTAELKAGDFIPSPLEEQKNELLQYIAPMPIVAPQPIISPTKTSRETEQLSLWDDLIPQPVVSIDTSQPPRNNNAIISKVVRESVIEANLKTIKNAVETIDKQQRDISEIQARVKFRNSRNPITPKQNTNKIQQGSAMSTDSLNDIEPNTKREPPNPTYNLIFTVHNCSNLPQLLSTTNAYCIVKFNGEDRKSKVKNSSNDPVFNSNNVFQNIRVIKYDQETGEKKEDEKVGVEVQVWSKNVFISDDFLGKVWVDIEEEEGEANFRLEPKVASVVLSEINLGTVKVSWRRDFWVETNEGDDGE
ncbi:hypothetical protein TrLO_g8024 [Triparma laevis f. longispina]|uniref:C2 domain-containing protein n=1 Tax=Triparma laevis f. longispina TaxID=1714387 RepID=A0A9W7L0J1_9STRA|nr:hypothetical protein TrLO_g8024 [Triparma laevis f. longispina]